jgi:NADPH-dependent F420 reductase
MTENNEKNIHTIVILGGTGKEGKGLAYRWAKAGYRIIIGSRLAEKAQSTVAEVLNHLGGIGDVRGMANAEAIPQGDIVVITVPYNVHRETLEGFKEILQGKYLVDVTVPLVPPKVSQVHVPEAGSAAQEAYRVLGDGVQIASAFQNISYENLWNDMPVECDVLVAGTSKEVRNLVIGLVEGAGMIGWDAGPLENAVVIEGMTSILIGLNRQYRVKSSGIRITGIPR